ncbi:DUF4167 domain-containing protein [Brevundimonas sp.]|uniref:DUF4167 domain-containing protein n=1 Tax=Brevundimonas sp. TaxID=1871086 RepID=UPI0028A27F0B|nr:DUF4167 domain-containing protein [Brevundimonas sp.]
MRDFKGMKRQRGRNRKPGGGGNNANATNPNRSWDSQGPENIKVRGNAQTVYERYMQLARDAAAAGDRVLAENYTQHAEHYFRVLRALQPQRPVSEIAQRELAGQGFDIDFEDESGAQAAAIIAAAAAEQQKAEDEARRQAERAERDANRDRDRDYNRDRDNNRDRDREPRAEREPRADDREPRAEGDREGGRRETRRERWERRREERNRRFEAGEATPEDEARALAEAEYAPDAAESVVGEPAPVAGEGEARPARAPRRPRAERAPAEAPADGEVSDGMGLPGFLTRPSTPAADEAEASEAPAPKRRAPRRKVEPAADEG